MKKSYLLLALLGIYCELFAQFEKADSSKIKMEFDIGLGGISSEYPFSKKIEMDQRIAAQRSSYSDYFTGYITDEPNEHGAIHTILSTKTTFRKGYEFYANLLMEHRGESYGGNDLNNTVVVPQMYGRLRDSLKIGGKSVEAFFHVGDLINYKMANGLQIYNIDVQGVILQLKHQNHYFKVVHLPDVSKGIGLALEEVFSFNLGSTFGKHQVNLSHDWNSNMLSNGTYTYYSHISLAYNTMLSEQLEFYSQIGSRKMPKDFSLQSSAAVLGFNTSFEFDKIQINLQPEFRYYSSWYNRNYLTPKVLYRDTNNPTTYSNTVGRYLYPLKNYYYSFSQWAVFTEYRNQDVTGMGLLADVKYQISNRLEARLELDFLRVKGERSGFNYFFYTWELYYKALKDLKIGFLVTNKTFNLDTHYQTFYMTRLPSLSLHLHKPLKPYW